MENKLYKKLQVKPGFNLLLLMPSDYYSEVLANVPAGVNLLTGNHQADALILMVKDAAELSRELKTVVPLLIPETVFWIAYPKKSSGILTDLNMMGPWDELTTYNLSACAAVSIDDIWTGIRVKPTGTSKASGLCNDDIQKNEYGEFIDVINKTVKLPDDLKIILEQHTTALSFFEQLSYTNRKEYVLWVLTAKQEKTRTDRIQKTLDKLLNRKKNPTEK